MLKKETKKTFTSSSHSRFVKTKRFWLSLYVKIQKRNKKKKSTVRVPHSFSFHKPHRKLRDCRVCYLSDGYGNKNFTFRCFVPFISMVHFIGHYHNVPTIYFHRNIFFYSRNHVCVERHVQMTAKFETARYNVVVCWKIFIFRRIYDEVKWSDQEYL